MNVIVKGKKGEPVDNFGGKLCAVVVVGRNGAQYLLRGNGAESDCLSLINGLNEVMRTVQKVIVCQCQTCQKAKAFPGSGICFACSDDKCEYEPFQNFATTSTEYNPTKIAYQTSNTTELKGERE